MQINEVDVARLLSPTVLGPIFPDSKFISVNGALEGAEVTLKANGRPVASGTATMNGFLELKVSGSLNEGEGVVASQKRGSDASGDSNTPVPVLGVPDPLPAPVFHSPLTTEMLDVYLGSLIPGARVTVRNSQGRIVCNAFEVGRPGEWLPLDPNVSISGSSTLTAFQQMGTAQSQATRSSAVIAINPKEPPPAPVIREPVTACETTIFMSGLTPAALTRVAVGGRAWTQFNGQPAFELGGIGPFREGVLEAFQTLRRHNVRGASTTVTVGPAQKPGVPVMQPFCPEAQHIIVSGLKPGASLTLWKRDPGGEEEIGTLGVGSEAMQVDLPEIIGGRGPFVQIIARQSLCGIVSDPGSASEFARPGSGALPSPTPEIVLPLYNCMTGVPVRRPTGVLTHVASATTGEQLGPKIVPTMAEFVMPLWLPLRAGDVVKIVQEGCEAPAETAPVTVQDLPSSLPVPKVQVPRPGDTIVVVEGCIRGARVHLRIDNNEVNSTSATWSGSAVFLLSSQLNEDQRLDAFQALCQKMSGIDEIGTTVTRGQLALTVAQSSSAPATPIKVTVRAHDVDTGRAINGLPLEMTGVAGAKTGEEFTVAIAQPPGIDGVVRGAPGYDDADFTVTVREEVIPVSVALIPGPMIVQDSVWHTDVLWTLTPQWTGAAPLKLDKNQGTLFVPKPPGGNGTVKIELRLKAHLQGNIGGIQWSHQTIDLEGVPAVLALIHPSHTITCLFEYGVVDKEKKYVLGARVTSYNIA